MKIECEHGIKFDSDDFCGEACVCNHECDNHAQKGRRRCLDNECPCVNFTQESL